MVQIKNVLFGKLAVSTRFITEEQLQECLDYQKEVEERGERPPRLGEILEQKGYLTKQQIQSILETMSSMQRRRFGEIAVAFHFITLEQLETCLDIQKLLQAPQETVPLFGQALVTYRGFLKQVLAGGTHPRIGDVLVAMGYMRNHQVEAVLEEQNKRIVRCKSCEASLNISRFEPGQKIKCGQCNAVLEVVKTEGSEDLDVALPTETVSAPAGGEVPAEDQPMDPATAMMELDKEIARVRATQQFAPGKLGKTPGRIADFQVVTRLGQDATGVIFKATQISKNRPVALKIMNPSVMNDPNFQKKFIDDAKKVAALEHPNIKKVFSLGKSDNRFYIAMEFVEAESVYNVLEKQGKFHFETAIGIAVSIGEGLQYAQQQGLIHGDVRPSNVLLLRDGTVKVANLGLATKVSENILAISRSGQMAPFYIAPECVTGDREMDQRTDIYSLGATLFHMVAGRPPFQGQSPFEVLVRLTEETIPPLKFFDPGIPDSVCRVVEKMLEAEPQDRYQTWEELLGELRAIQAAAGGGAAAAPAVPGAVAGAPSAAGMPAPVKTAEDAKRAYESRTSRAAQMRSLRRAAITIVIIGGLGGGGLYLKNHLAATDRKDEWTRLQGQYTTQPSTATEFELRKDKFRRFAAAHPNSVEASEALSQVIKFESLEVSAKEKELVQIRAEVAKLLTEQQFKAASDALGRGNFWKRDDPQMQSMLPQITDAAAADWVQVREKALAMARADQIQKARVFVDEAVARRQWATDLELSQKLAGEIDVVRRELLAQRAVEEEAERKRKSREVLDTGIKDALDQMRKCQFQTAVQKLSMLKTVVHADHLAELAEWTERAQWSWDLQTNAVVAVNEKAADFSRTHDVANDKRPTQTMTSKLEGRAIGASANAITFQDSKATVTEPIAWPDLDPATLTYILGLGMQQAGATSQSHFAFADGVSFRAESTTDVATKARLMTVAEREYKAAFDMGLQKQAGPRMEFVAKYFTGAKAEYLASAKSLIEAKKYSDARKELRTLLNQFPTRLDDVMKDIHALFESSLAGGQGGQYFNFLSGVPAALKPTTGWTAARGVATVTGKDETIEVAGKTKDVAILFRLPDDQVTLSLEMEGVTVRFLPNANSGAGNIEVKYWKDKEEDGKRSLGNQAKPAKMPVIAERVWHIMEVREIEAGGGSTIELAVDGAVLALVPKSAAVISPLGALTVRVTGSSSGKEGRIDLLGLFARTR